MTIANVDTEQTYDGDGATVNFPITFALFEKAVVKVFLLNELVPDASTPSGLDETEQFESTHFTFDAATPPTQVQMIITPTGDQKLRVERLSPRTQNSNMVAGTDVAEATEQGLDRQTMVAQEIDREVGRVEDLISPAPSAGTGAVAPDWITATTYVVDQLVVRTNVLYRCLIAHTSNVFDTDFLTNNFWQVMVGLTGPQGNQGDPGPTGAAGLNGAAGATGLTGAAGNDGIFVAIASQGEAQAGIENTKGMTPLRTAEAITAQVNKAGIVTNTNNIAILVAQMGALTSRVTILESLIQQSTGKFAGQQVCLNTQGAPVELLGLVNGGADDKGASLNRQSSGAEFAKVLMLVRRVTDTEDRFASWDLVMQFTGGVWLIGREDTQQLDVTLDLDGIVLSVATDGSGIGQVSYTSDTMAGANHDTQSIIAWLGQEISKC